MRTQKRAIAYLPNAILIASMLILPALTYAQELNTSSTRRSWGYAFASGQKEEKYRFVPLISDGVNGPGAVYGFKRVSLGSTFQFSRAGVG